MYITKYMFAISHKIYSNDVYAHKLRWVAIANRMFVFSNITGNDEIIGAMTNTIFGTLVQMTAD